MDLLWHVIHPEERSERRRLSGGGGGWYERGRGLVVNKPNDKILKTLIILHVKFLY